MNPREGPGGLLVYEDPTLTVQEVSDWGRTRRSVGEDGMNKGRRTTHLMNDKKLIGSDTERTEVC